MVRSAGALIVILLLPRGLLATTVTEVHYVMGTYFQATVEHLDPEQARRAMRTCFATARRFDELFSRFDPVSELSQVNGSTDAPSTRVSSEMATLLTRALELRQVTHGAFDVSGGALTSLWRTAGEWPAPDAVSRARASAGEGSFSLTASTLTRRPGVRIDLDGVAKGWAIDHCAAQLRAAGITRAFLSLGESSLYALGAPAGMPGWVVELRATDGTATLGTLQLRDQALSVSAVFGHEWQIGGRRVGHIVDPRTGYPLTTAGMAVVVAASATDAEALSKALLVHGDPQLPRRTRGGPVHGALLVRPDGVRRRGHVRFTPYVASHVLTADAEPLR